METYESSAGEVTAIVDFAHNGLSFEKMFDTVALEYPGSRVSVVFGTPGGKAFNRRKDMGEISGKRADGFSSYRMIRETKIRRRSVRRSAGT